MPSDLDHPVLTIYHRFTLKFILTQQGQVFSMDQANTFYDPNARTISHISLDKIDDSFTKGDQSFKSYRMDFPSWVSVLPDLDPQLLCLVRPDLHRPEEGRYLIARY